MELAFRRWPAQHEESGKVVLLHGMGGTGALWRPVAAGLEPDLSVLALDQRGHGGSRPAHPPSFGPIDYGRDVIDTLNAQDFTPAWIVGHSMGVRTACAAAHLAPRSVRGLVLIDLGFYGPAGGGLGETLATFLKVLPPAFPTRAEARQFMEERCPDPSIAQYLMAVLSLGPKGPDSVAFHSIKTHCSKQSLPLKISTSVRGSVKHWSRAFQFWHCGAVTAASGRRVNLSQRNSDLHPCREFISRNSREQGTDFPLINVSDLSKD